MRRIAWCWVVMLLALAVSSASAQVPTDAFSGMRIRRVDVELSPVPTDTLAATNLEGAVRLAFGLFPGRRIDTQTLDFGI